MPRYMGKDGIVDVGGNAVAEVRQFEINETGPVAEAPAMGRAWVAQDVGAVRVSGTVTCWSDPADATGQGALVFGAHVALTLQPQGVGSGLPQYALTDAVITDVAETLERDSWTEITFSWVANSQLDKTAQT